MEIKKNKSGNWEASFNSPINIERSSSPVMEHVGQLDSTMELWMDEGHAPTGIEWVVDDGQFVEDIGLVFDGKTLTDYDGVFSLPKEAIQLIRKAGFIVPSDFESQHCRQSFLMT